MGERRSFLLRIDPSLWREIEAWAADDLRSVNGQVEWLLREAVARRRRALPAAPPPAAPPPANGAGEGNAPSR